MLNCNWLQFNIIIISVAEKNSCPEYMLHCHTLWHACVKTFVMNVVTGENKKKSGFMLPYSKLNQKNSVPITAAIMKL